MEEEKQLALSMMGVGADDPYPFHRQFSIEFAAFERFHRLDEISLSCRVKV